MPTPSARGDGFAEIFGDDVDGAALHAETIDTSSTHREKAAHNHQKRPDPDQSISSARSSS